MSQKLTTNYIGLQLDSPVIVGACPLTVEPETVRQLVDSGAGAIVLPSILQEQIIYAKTKPHDPLGAIERSGYQPQQDKYNGGVENYLKTIQYLKANHHVPIIGSINGGSIGEWVEFAKEIESSGADAIEINWQQSLMNPNESADQVEERLCEWVRHMCTRVKIPVAVKLNHRFTNLASIAGKLQSAGAVGLTLFTHLPHWDVSIDRLRWTIRWELSPVDSLGGILEGIVCVRNGAQNTSIAASGGVRTAEDAIKAMIAGADVVMVTSEIYRQGPDAIRKMVAGITRYLDQSPYESLLAFKQARPKIEFGPKRLMRLEYVDPLTRSDHYFDPTPVANSNTGDEFGHQQ